MKNQEPLEKNFETIITPLKPCHFCNGITLRLINSVDKWYVLCVDCGAEGPKKTNPISAGRLWNISR